MTENENWKEGDDLMTCFVIHVSLLSLHIFLETAVLQKGLSFTTHSSFQEGRHTGLVDKTKDTFWRNTVEGRASPDLQAAYAHPKLSSGQDLNSVWT